MSIVEGLEENIVLVQEQTNVTQVNPQVFEKMITNTGVSIAELNQKGYKVILFFASSVGCPFCVGTINDIYDLKDQLLLLNTIPVIVHDESDKVYDQFIQSSPTTKKFVDLLHMNRDNFKKEFKLGMLNFDLKEIVYQITHMMSEFTRLRKLGINGNPKLFTEETTKMLSAVFVVYDCKIISEYRKEHKYQRFDVARVLIDTDGLGIEVHTSVFACEVPMKPEKKQIPQDKKMRKSASFASFFQKKQSSNNLLEKKLSLADVLDNPKYLKHFKLFATKEYSVENVVFYEEVQKYKAMTEDARKVRSEQFFDVFFKPDSIYEINTSKKIIESLKESFENDPTDKELFDVVLQDVKNSTLYDVHKRFIFSPAYEEMLKANRRASYFLVK